VSRPFFKLFKGEYGLDSKSPIPLKVKGNETSEAALFIGDNPEKTVPKEVILFFRLDKYPEFDISVNGKKYNRET